jgi:hypothetical protein
VNEEAVPGENISGDPSGSYDFFQTEVLTIITPSLITIIIIITIIMTPLSPFTRG